MLVTLGFPKKVLTQVSWNLVAGVALVVFELYSKASRIKRVGWGGGGVETSAKNVAFLFCSNSVKNFICSGTFVFFRVFLMVVQWTKNKYTSPSPALLSIPGTHGYGHPPWTRHIRLGSIRSSPEYFCFCHLEDSRTSFRCCM